MAVYQPLNGNYIYENIDLLEGHSLFEEIDMTSSKILGKTFHFFRIE